LVVFLKCFLVGHMIITYEEPKKYLTKITKKEA
jgi:hypothetical protein